MIDLDLEKNPCPECNQINKYSCLEWCQICNYKRYQKDFNKWTSGNELINKFIQDAQLKARNNRETMEWIPYDRFRNIQYLAQGGFSTVFKAIWLDGSIDKWDCENQQWERDSYKLEDEEYENAKQENIKSPLNENESAGLLVVLKSLNNSSNINENFLNEWKNYLKYMYSTSDNLAPEIRLFGITQDPETSNYMIVMEHMELAQSLSALHECNLVHGDFHSGNLLSYEHNFVLISDFGLSKPADKPTKSDEVYGVLPYIAPEVLRGKPYTKAADIYSFGIIMWEMTSGIPAFNNVPHDFNLSLKICQGLRPKIVKGTDDEYAKLMKKCWHSDPNKRPTAKDLCNFFGSNILIHFSDYRVQVPDNEPIIQNHPLSFYTSRKIDYSSKLNEILNQDELSSKILVTDNFKETMLSESLGNCL
ncbi:kinase-like domain-containing protein, partial [Glomus cerebriforme]